MTRLPPTLAMRTLPMLCLILTAAHCWSAPACGGSPDPAAVVQAQVDAYNRHDVDAFLSCYADEATVTWLDSKKAPVKGMDALRAQFAFLTKIPLAGAGFGVDVLMKTVTGPTVANVEPTRGLPPNARPAPDTLVIYEVRDGKIVNAWFAPAK